MRSLVAILQQSFSFLTRPDARQHYFWGMWCIFCLSSSSDEHHLLHSCFWHRHAGLDHKTSFVILVHLWFIRRPPSIVFCCRWCVGGSSITILPLLVQIIRTLATVTTPFQCVLENTLRYHDTVDFVQDPETEDPQCFPPISP